MVNWKGHVAGGFVLVFFLFIFNLLIPITPFKLEFIDYMLVIPIIFFFSLAPDLDHHNSLIKMIVTILGLILITILLLTMNILLAIILVIALLTTWILPMFHGFHHRGHMHSLIFGFILAVPILIFISWQMFIIAMIAFFSHLVLDMDVKIW